MRKYWWVRPAGRVFACTTRAISSCIWACVRQMVAPAHPLAGYGAVSTIRPPKWESYAATLPAASLYCVATDSTFCRPAPPLVCGSVLSCARSTKN